MYRVINSFCNVLQLLSLASINAMDISLYLKYVIFNLIEEVYRSKAIEINPFTSAEVREPLLSHKLQLKLPKIDPPLDTISLNQLTLAVYALTRSGFGKEIQAKVVAHRPTIVKTRDTKVGGFELPYYSVQLMTNIVRCTANILHFVVHSNQSQQKCKRIIQLSHTLPFRPSAESNHKLSRRGYTLRNHVHCHHQVAA